MCAYVVLCVCVCVCVNVCLCVYVSRGLEDRRVTTPLKFLLFFLRSFFLFLLFILFFSFFLFFSFPFLSFSGRGNTLFTQNWTQSDFFFPKNSEVELDYAGLGRGGWLLEFRTRISFLRDHVGWRTENRAIDI